MSHYIRKHEPGEPLPRGWSLVTIPPDQHDTGGTYAVYEPLATEMNRLLKTGQPQAARALFFWFDTEGT